MGAAFFVSLLDHSAAFMEHRDVSLPVVGDHEVDLFHRALKERLNLRVENSNIPWRRRRHHDRVRELQSESRAFLRRQQVTLIENQ